MLEVSSVVPVKYKRRKVSAIRDFPKGCGILAVDVNLIPSKEPPPSVELECVKVTNSDEVSLEQVESVGCWKVPKEEAKVLNGSTVPLMPEAVESKDSRILGAGAKEEVEEGEGTKGLPEKIVKLEASELSKESLDRPELLDGSKIDGDVDKQVYSEKYIALKRRKVSAIRDFPVGCGRNAPTISKEKHSEVAAVASSDGKNLDGKKKPAASSNSNTVDGEKKSVVSQHPMFEGSVGVESTEKAEANVRKTDVEPTRVRVQKINGEATVKSPKVKNLDGEKKSAVSQQPMVEGSVWVESTEKAEEEVRKKDAGPIRVQENNGGARVKSPKVKSLDGEKKPVAKQQAVMEGSVRVSSGEKVEGEVKRNDAKQIREKVREINVEARVKSPSWSGLKENTVEDLSEKKILVRYPSEKKLEGRDVKHVSKNLQVKESQDARPQSGSKVVDKEGGNLIGKPVDKGSIKRPKDGKNLKRKFLEEVEDEGHVPDDQTRGNESLEAYGDRLIVQALMAAENCPWRKGKKSIATSSRSVMPKSKKEQKLLGSNFASKGFSTSQHKKKVDVEDEEDSVPQDDGNEKALTTYKSSRALSVTVTPSVPSRLNRKGASSEDAVTRNMVKKTLRLFQVVCRKLLQGEESRSKEYGKTQRVDLKAASILKENNEWVNYGMPILGDVPGVEVGDEFHYRVELSIIGLHRPFQGGIDYMKKDGNVLTTSIVASGGYPDDMDSSDVLIYSGSGGNPVGGGDKQPGDQKLERGNLALKNSIDAKTPVRVIHGFKEKGSDSHDARAKIVSTFTYDGLYLVESYRQEKGPHGFSVFKFQLRRMPGQPELALKEVKKTKKSKVREGLCVKDISNGKESIPICAVNTIDDDQPMPFKYITKIIYPSWYVQKPPRGCDCTDGCSDSEKCACAVKNGGEIPFNFNGAIVQAKPLVFECGPSCKCPPSCHNRVSQHGIRIPLEIFKTKSRGWGVRSLYSIPSGTFICEYIGEMLQDTEAEQRSNDEYLFDIGHNYDDRSLWEGLPTLIPGLQSNAVCETVEDVGFTIDAAEYGNVGRFINHNCSPNLYAQNVLYDHDDKRMPHIMFFAADNIPPLQELTYHYNYMIDQVRDSEGHIKRKDCFCGSPECTGRLY